MFSSAQNEHSYYVFLNHQFVAVYGELSEKWIVSGQFAAVPLHSQRPAHQQ